MSKRERQRAILQIIEKGEAKNQNELKKKLDRLGIVVSQATLSRDLKELGIIKVIDKRGGFRYGTMAREELHLEQKLQFTFQNFVKEIIQVNNLVLIKTLAGNAHGVASLIDSYEIQGILGTVAGDDTILVVVDHSKNARQIAENFRQLINS